VHSTAYRTHTCGDLREGDAGSKVTLAGWVHRRRDQGGIVFLDLRDRYGLTQVSFNLDDNPAAHAVAMTTKPEFTLQVTGTVAVRPDPNPKLPTGAIEVIVDTARVLSESPTPPFDIAAAAREEVSDEIRLRHRPLDMRRPEVQDRLLRRHRMNAEIRRFFEARGFCEIETPILAKATPEGARDYLVPSRLHKGNFYALPQAPQIYKQILMCSGFDRYYQIARCFRDEDLRADRQPEFTQLDLEMSYVEQEDVLGLIEEMITGLVRDVAKHPAELPLPWPRIPYAEALLKYGTDKPDLRYGLEIEDVTEQVRGCEFKVFSGAVEAGGAVRLIRVPGAAGLSRKQVESYQPVAAEHGAKGLAWLKCTEEGATGPVAKFFPDAFGARPGELLLFVADPSVDVVAWSLGAVRCAIAEAQGIVPKDAFAACFVVDFPMFLPGDNAGEWVPAHHPFTSPAEEDLEKLESDPQNVRAKAYDPVLNGVELGSGSIRIHRSDIQSRVLKAIGLSPEEAEAKFGFLLEVLKYGAPPHGGIALGLDRLAMLLSGDESIREVIAFPKTARAVDLMSDSPSGVEPDQLEELGIALRDGV
jgi:aspartyl-tRNA synthetase